MNIQHRIKRYLKKMAFIFSFAEFHKHTTIIKISILTLKKLWIQQLQTLKNNPKYFLSEMLNKPPIFGGQLIQFTKGIKKIKTFDYCIVGTNQNNWTVREQPSSLTSDTFITFSGTYTNAQNYFMQNFRSLYPSSDYKKLITDLIRIEAQNNNYKVGMPVNVLAIQNDSHTWYLDNY